MNPAGGLPAVKTLICTVSVDNDCPTDDYQFDRVANADKQTIVIENILPAYAGLLGWQVRCLETVTDGVSMLIDVGTTSGGSELGTGSPSAANDVIGTTGIGTPQLAAANVAQSIYVSATPNANWSALNAGRWAVVLTYIDYSIPYRGALTRVVNTSRR